MVSVYMVNEMAVRGRKLGEDSSSSSPTDAVIFVGISLVLGIASRHALRGTRVPYTVALLVLGICLGALEYGTNLGLGKIGNGIRLWANIDPDLLLAVFLPALLFESSFLMEVHQIKKCMMQMFILAGPGVLISTFCVGSALKRRILNYTKHEMLNKALGAFGDLGDDEELGPVDWPTVKQYITCLNDIDGEQIHPHSSLELDHNLNHLNLKDIRVRFLNGIQAAYWTMLNEGRITQTTANLLMLSVDEAIDVVSHEPLCDWKGLKSYVNVWNYSRYLQSNIFPQKLVNFFTIGRLELACSICAAFLRAHRIARQQLHDFIGDSDISAAVHRESLEEGEEARTFLEDVRGSFPQVLRVVKTRQVTYSVLNHLISYVHNLEKIGILEEKEMTQLHDAVQADLKKLLRNPPFVRLPNISDLITSNPLLGVLPSSLRETLVGSTKEAMKMRGVTLYREGSKSAGIWLISNGVVKWSSKSSTSRNPLHPTFTHGSTLGLYEVLAEKPYICDIITDSVVLCFFIETEKILSALRSDPSIEHFFWQESAIVLSKLMLPQIFEKLSMQDVRTIIAERSTTNIYIRGESFEVLHSSVGLLLEGFIKLLGGQEELLTAPAAIAFSNVGTRDGSLSHLMSSYQVESRTRVILFDVSGYDFSRIPRKRSSSKSLQLADHHSGSIVREHSGFMSWPEQSFHSKQHSALETSNRSGNNLSARAMELSVYGSMVNHGKHGSSSYPRRRKVRASHSQSYPRFRSANTLSPLVSAKSEGSTTLRKKHSLQLQPKDPKEKSVARDDSSDESNGEDELVVRIDSPSTLSFRQAL